MCREPARSKFFGPFSKILAHPTSTACPSPRYKLARSAPTQTLTLFSSRPPQERTRAQPWVSSRPFALSPASPPLVCLRSRWQSYLTPRLDAPLAGAYKFVSELWRRKQSDVMRFVQRVRCWEYRQQPAIVRITRPTRPDRARRLGFKAKQVTHSLDLSALPTFTCVFLPKIVQMDLHIVRTCCVCLSSFSELFNI
jgi:hypothetical protein